MRGDDCDVIAGTDHCGLAQRQDMIRWRGLTFACEQTLVLEEDHGVVAADRGGDMPTMSAGVDGATILRPGMVKTQFSTAWEC